MAMQALKKLCSKNTPDDPPIFEISPYQFIFYKK